MLKVGLTGGIGSGKSTVARMFETLGVPVYYADEAARRIMNTDKEVMASITREFGPESYQEGRLNRAYIASLVFNDSQKLERLNAFTHPATIADAKKWMQEQQASYAIKEAALLFESGSHQELDFIIGVSAPAGQRILRTMKRDGISREEVEKRISRQMDEEEKMERCQAVLINDELTPLLPQVLSLHKKLLTLAGSSQPGASSRS